MNLGVRVERGLEWVYGVDACVDGSVDARQARCTWDAVRGRLAQVGRCEDDP